MDRHDKRDIIKVDKKIHSIRITKELLKGLADIVEDAYNEVMRDNEDKYSRTSYVINEKDVTTTFENRSNFILDYLDRHDFLREVKFVILRLHSDKKEITVSLTLTVYLNSGFIVEGNSSTWVFGKIGLLSELFKEFKTPNEFFHSYKCWFAYIPAGVFFAITTGVMLSDDTLGFIVWSILYPVNFNFFFGWLYTKNETEYSIQVRLRKKILGGVGVIFSSLIGGFIWELIKGPLNFINEIY